jgi:hypothetical protein
MVNEALANGKVIFAACLGQAGEVRLAVDLRSPAARRCLMPVSVPGTSAATLRGRGVTPGQFGFLSLLARALGTQINSASISVAQRRAWLG